MSELQNGALVQHVSLGLGKIVALEPGAVHVFFPSADKRFAAKLRLPAARPLLRTEGFEPDGWLAGLSAFSLDETTGRYALSATFMTHDQAVAQFKELHPSGFRGAAGAKGREARPAAWRAARAAWEKHLGHGELARLVEEGEVDILVRRAREIEKALEPLHPPSDVGALEAALADEALARPFFVALAELLSVPTPGKARFEKLFSAARALPVEPAQQWLVATIFPFLAEPTRHVLLRPRTTCLAADRLGADVRFQPAPIWTTYSSLRDLQTRLLQRLAPEGAEDFGDVEAFLHVVAVGRRSTAAAKVAKKPAAEAKPRAGGRSRA